MKTILALLLSLTIPLAGQNRIGLEPHSSRPLLDMRGVVGVVPHAAGIDVYWQRTNELETPIRSKLMRTTVSSDGTSRLSRVLLKEFDDDGWAAGVDGEGTNVQAIWKNFSGGIMASPVVNGALKYPEGKLVSFGDYPYITCHASECAVISTWVGQRATILDADSNVVGSFTLPDGFHQLRVSFSERGLFYVRNQLKQARAALVRRDGSVQYDVAIVDTDAMAFETSALAVVANGTQHVVAFVDFAPEPVEVHAVTISDDGTMSEPVRLAQAAPSYPDHPSHVASLSLAWNGTTYVLGYGGGGSALRRFDSAFHPLDAEPQLDGDWPSVSVHADGQRFVIAWSARKPYVTILSPNGEMTPRLEIDPTPRRRSVR